MKSKLVFLFIVVVLLGLGAVIRFPNSGERRGLVKTLDLDRLRRGQCTHEQRKQQGLQAFAVHPFLCTVT